MSAAAEVTTVKKSKKDYASDQAVRWCPGCGDYAILTAVQNALAEIQAENHNTVFVSGIGCSSRFPYYMETYGLHSIHGRAPAFATGVKVANKDLDVWLVSGDGDSLSIGGNHFIHSLRRNISIKYLIFNNEIYGLTKGQYSPTSQTGKVAKSTPYGSVDRTFVPGSLAIGAEATFYARVADTTPKDMKEVFVQASKHRGNAMIEVLQNCVIFNDKVFAPVTDRETRADRQIYLQHGKPMIFGQNNDKGLILDGTDLKVVTLGENGITEKDLLVHDAHKKSPNLHFMLARMQYPEFPVAMGIIRQVEESVYEEDVIKQIEDVKAKKGNGDLQKLLNSGETWVVN